MSREKQKSPALAETEKREKAKVAIVGLIDAVPSILVLTRSELEDTRAGEGDWAGGTLDPDEKPISGLIREVEEELPGTTLHNITELTVRRKMKDGVLVTSHLFAATADFPPDGIALSFEHSDYAWVPLDEFPTVEIPKKYRETVASDSGRSILDGLVQTLRQEPAPPHL